jgi:hypothetical protein
MDLEDDEYPAMTKLLYLVIHRHNRNSSLMFAYAVERSQSWALPCRVCIRGRSEGSRLFHGQNSPKIRKLIWIDGNMAWIESIMAFCCSGEIHIWIVPRSSKGSSLATPSPLLCRSTPVSFGTLISIPFVQCLSLRNLALLLPSGRPENSRRPQPGLVNFSSSTKPHHHHLLKIANPFLRPHFTSQPTQSFHPSPSPSPTHPLSPH